VGEQVMWLNCACHPLNACDLAGLRDLSRPEVCGIGLGREGSVLAVFETDQ